MKQWNNVSIKVKDNQGNWVAIPGIAGESAYEIAVRNGTFSGTEEQWLNALETERSAAVASIQAAGAATIASIPNEYTTLSNEVSQLSDDINSGEYIPELILNSYVETDGTITPYTNWIRTDFIPCGGLDYIYIVCPDNVTSYKYNCFYTSNDDATFVSNFNIVNNGVARIPVPDTAKYFILSNQRIIMEGIKIYTNMRTLININADDIQTLADSADEFTRKYKYWDSEIKGTIDDVNDYMWDSTNQNEETAVIGFVTDTHIENSANTWGKVLKTLDNTLHFETVVHGGDQVSSNPSNTAYLQDMQKSVALMNGIRNKLCIIMGNHDVYNTAVSYLPPSAHRWLLTTDFMREHGHFLAQSDNKNTHWLTYYRDDAYYGIRYIFIDDCYGQGSRLNQGDINWINSTLKSTPAGYHVAVFVHNAGIFDDVYGTTVDNFQMEGRDCFYKMLYAFSTGGTVNETYTYTYGGTSYTVTLTEDYSTIHRPVVGVFAGHIHCDELFVFEGINICITTSGMLSGFIDTGSSLTSDDRQSGTDTETAVDVICINKAKKEVKLFRCGYGADRSFSYATT